MAERMGADLIVDPAEASPHSKWAEMGVAGTGTEQMIARQMGQSIKRAIIFECVGLPGVLASLIDGAPANAQIVVAGVCVEADTFEPYICIQKQIDLRFVIGYTRMEFAQTLSAIAEGQIEAERIITDAVGFADVADAFERLAKPVDQIKVVVESSLG
jgi:threonine dehydrogenase-like Zn-dependent dehydrogenase